MCSHFIGPQRKLNGKVLAALGLLRFLRLNCLLLRCRALLGFVGALLQLGKLLVKRCEGCDFFPTVFSW